MSSIPLLLAVVLPLFGAVVLFAAVAVRTSGQCRHRVAHARVVAQAGRIEDMRRRQMMSRLHPSEPGPAPMATILPGLADSGDHAG